MREPGQNRDHHQAQQRNYTGQGFLPSVVDNAKIFPHGGQSGNGNEHCEDRAAAIKNINQHRQKQESCNPSF